MPYIPIEPHRRLLDPNIDIIVEKISVLRPVNIIHLFEAQLLTVKHLALLLHPSCKQGVLDNWVWANKMTPHETLKNHMTIPDTGVSLLIKNWYFLKELKQINDLVEKIEEIVKQTEAHAWVGMLNYCCTEILLLSTDGRRYHIMSLLGGICDRVAYELEKFFTEDDEIGLRIVRVFRDIAAEFYRRIVGPYEDTLINQKQDTHGDTRGYLKWLPPSEK